MILTDSEIEADKSLIQRIAPTQIKSCSYDLRIGTIFDGKVKKGLRTDEDVVILNPGDIISVFTLESIALPHDMCATVFAINAQSSQGILVLNPGHVDPGFEGVLCAKIINISSTPRTIAIGDSIFTVVFQRIGKSVAHPYYGNCPLEERRRQFNSLDVQNNPRSLGKVLLAGRPLPIVTEEQVYRIITRHWITWITIIAAVTAALASILALLKP